MDVSDVFRMLMLKRKVVFTHPFTNRKRFGLVDSVGAERSIIKYTTRRGFELSYTIKNKDIMEA